MAKRNAKSSDSGGIPQDEIDKLLGEGSPQSDSSKKGQSEILGEDEIATLLNAIAAPGSNENSSSETRTKKIKIYDFKRPDILTKDQLNQVGIIFENVCRNLTTYFCDKLQKECSFHVSSVDQLTVEEVLRTISSPTTIATALWENKRTALEINPELTFECLACLNSDKAAELDSEFSKRNLSKEALDEVSAVVRAFFSNQHTDRPLTTVEAVLVKKLIIKPIFEFTTQSFNDWQEFTESTQSQKSTERSPIAEPTKIEIESNPQFVQVAPSSMMSVLITITGKIGDEYGMINVCLPQPFLTDVLLKKEILMKNLTDNRFSLQVVPGNSAVSLGEFNMPEGEKLENGTIIELDKLAGEPVDLFDKKTGKVFARAEVVVVDEKFGVRVTEVLP